MKGRLPAWFAQKPPDPAQTERVDGLMNRLGLNTICRSASCPNLGTCFSRWTSTFLILGSVCTRNCTFCAVEKGIPSVVDEYEPWRLCEAAVSLGLEYVVVTSVTRDDLPDGGAAQFARVIGALHSIGVAVEVLVPDFCGSLESLGVVVNAHPEVLNHNVETVPRLYREVRPIADYGRSIRLLYEAKRMRPGMTTKSGMMLGLGESRHEVLAVLSDLRETGCDLVTMGQYLQPSPNHHPVLRYLSPEEFAEYGEIGMGMGFGGVASSPLVRSSFDAARMYAAVRQGPGVLPLVEEKETRNG
jgi:lipoic acid synthetase